MSSSDLQQRLAANGALLLDGGMGSMLLAAGLQSGACPELWNVERPDDVRAVHTGYRNAGAQILTTNTFGGSPARLAHFGLAERCAELNRAGAELARAAAGDELLVAGCVGPTGSLLAPFGPLSEADALQGYEQQVQALVTGGVDLLLVETMSDLTEACAAVRAAAATDLPVAATMTFERGKRGYFTVMGVTPEQAAHGLAEAGAVAVGANCGFGPDQMIELARQFRAATELPLVIQSNAGLPEVRGAEVHYPETPAGMAGYMPALAALRPALIGGCCGTTPDHLSAMSDALTAALSDLAATSGQDRGAP